MDESVFASLTPRERECLRGVRALQGSGQIAQRLGIAAGTVDTYLGSARAKLGARDRKHAAMLFAEHEEAVDGNPHLVPQKFACENLGLAGGRSDTSLRPAIGDHRPTGLDRKSVV